MTNDRTGPEPGEGLKGPQTEEPEGPRTPWQHAGDLVYEIARLASSEKGEFHTLRRLDPNRPAGRSWTRLMERHKLWGDEAEERRWAIVIQGMAQTTGVRAGRAVPAHHPMIPVGQALYQGGRTPASKGNGWYSKGRLRQLLNAEGPVFEENLRTLFQALGRNGVRFNWREMASFIIGASQDETEREKRRRKIQQDYARAAYQNRKELESES